MQIRFVQCKSGEDRLAGAACEAVGEHALVVGDPDTQARNGVLVPRTVRQPAVARAAHPIKAGKEALNELAHRVRPQVASRIVTPGPVCHRYTAAAATAKTFTLATLSEGLAGLEL